MLVDKRGRPVPRPAALEIAPAISERGGTCMEQLRRMSLPSVSKPAPV